MPRQSRGSGRSAQCPQILAPISSVDKVIQIVNVNTASWEELSTLPGVGKKLAEKIIIARQQKKFTSLQDLEKVPGISNKMIANWQGYIEL